MSPRRDFIGCVSLIVLSALALPLLVSFFADLTGGATSAGQAAIEVQSETPRPTSTSTLTRTETASPTPSTTRTATSTNTPTATATPTSTSTPTATPRPRVYIAPFVQVFAVGLPQPNLSSAVQLYEGGNDVFELVAFQGSFARLQASDGKFNFWTEITNLSSNPFGPAQYDFSVRGKTATIVSPTLLACVNNEKPTLAFGACQQMSGLKSVVLVAGAKTQTSSFYLAQIGGTQYYIPGSAVGSIS